MEITHHRVEFGHAVTDRRSSREYYAFAAGQLIESTTKSVRRKQTVDDAFIEKLFADTASLYHLDQLQAQGGLGGGGDLGPLPGLSVGLLACLGGIWALLLAKWLIDAIKMKKLQNKG